MNPEFDAIVIGAGHNGLVTAARLAQSGQRVLVLESREVVGGAVTSEEVFPGCLVDGGGSDTALFHQRIVDELSLTDHGLEFHRGPAALFAPGTDGNALTLWHDSDRTVEEIARTSPADAERYPAFAQEVQRMAAMLRGVALETPPDLKQRTRRDLAVWGKAAWRLKRLGRSEMMEFLRVLPMPVKDYLDERLGNAHLKGLLAATGVSGLALGPRAGGTTLMWLYQNCGGFLDCRYVKGGIGRLSHALEKSALAQGAEIRTGAAVSRVTLKYDNGYRATGVELVGGEHLTAATVISNADPRRTLFGLVGPQCLDPSIMREIRSIRFQGCVAKMDLLLDDLPTFAGQVDADQLSGRTRICPDMDYLERASDDAKYGRPSRAPMLDIFIPTVLDPTLAPAGTHLMNVIMQYAPYELREGNWEDRKHELTESIIDTLSQYVPGLRQQIRHQRILTPLDLESRLGLTGGCIHHGRMGLDSMLIQRPIARWSRYRSPIEGLYLCGAGNHPGGGVTGAPGYNAAREILMDRR